MKVFYIPVTVIEYGRFVVIEAESKAIALTEFRNRQWELMTDADDYKITKVGAIREVSRTDPTKEPK